MALFAKISNSMKKGYRLVAFEDFLFESGLFSVVTGKKEYFSSDSTWIIHPGFTFFRQYKTCSVNDIHPSPSGGRYRKTFLFPFFSAKISRQFTPTTFHSPLRTSLSFTSTFFVVLSLSFFFKQPGHNTKHKNTTINTIPLFTFHLCA
jgi:hypothetical protein